VAHVHVQGRADRDGAEAHAHVVLWAPGATMSWPGVANGHHMSTECKHLPCNTDLANEHPQT
jgi:hypothetical protein